MAEEGYLWPVSFTAAIAGKPLHAQALCLLNHLLDTVPEAWVLQVRRSIAMFPRCRLAALLLLSACSEQQLGV